MLYDLLEKLNSLKGQIINSLNIILQELVINNVNIYSIEMIKYLKDENIASVFLEIEKELNKHNILLDHKELIDIIILDTAKYLSANEPLTISEYEDKLETFLNICANTPYRLIRHIKYIAKTIPVSTVSSFQPLINDLCITSIEHINLDSNLFTEAIDDNTFYEDLNTKFVLEEHMQELNNVQSDIELISDCTLFNSCKQTNQIYDESDIVKMSVCISMIYYKYLFFNLRNCEKIS